jgi:hypothetical protein
LPLVKKDAFQGRVNGYIWQMNQTNVNNGYFNLYRPLFGRPSWTKSANIEPWLLPSLTDSTFAKAYDRNGDPGADCISNVVFLKNLCKCVGIPGSFYDKYYIAYYQTPDNLNRPTVTVEASVSNNLANPRIKHRGRKAVMNRFTVSAVCMIAALLLQVIPNGWAEQASHNEAKSAEKEAKVKEVNAKKWKRMFGGNIDFTEKGLYGCMSYVHPQPDMLMVDLDDKKSHRNIFRVWNGTLPQAGISVRCEEARSRQVLPAQKR